MKTVIISGANGFVGGALVRELLQHDYRIYALDREGCCDDVRDTPSAKIIRALGEMGYTNIIAYDPVAMEEFRKHYDIALECCDTCDDVLRKADILAITTAWPEFRDIKTKTDKTIVDWRYML